jgi:carbamoyltransferase
LRQIYRYHPLIGFTFVPDLKARVPHEGGGYLVRTNEQGFRSDRPFAKARTPGRRRVLLFGDSFTAGEGVSNGQRYGDHLERLVPELEVYNFGLPATGTDQHYLIHREFATEIEHDLVVIGVFVENIRRVASRYRYFHDDEGRPVLFAKPWFQLSPDGALALHGVPPRKQPLREEELPPEEREHIAAVARFPRLKTAFDALRGSALFEKAVVRSGLKDRVQRATGYQPLTEYDDPASLAWRTMRAVLYTWIRACAQPVALVPIPLYQYAAGISDATPYLERLAEAARSAGAELWDPLAHLRSAGEQVELYFPGDGHLTNAGHAALAEFLAPRVEQALARNRAQP